MKRLLLFACLLFVSCTVAEATPAKYGPKGGSVATDTSLIGNGSASSPLGINPAAALAPDWYGYARALFQQKTGLAPIDIQEECRDSFGFSRGGIGNPAGDGFAVVGTGAATTRDVTQAGAYKMVGPTSGSGQAVWGEDSATGNQYALNPQTHLWAVFYRVAVGQAPVAASEVSIGIRSGATYVGLGYVGAQANWQYVRGALGSKVNIASLGKSIDSTGHQYLTMYVGNFDLVNVKANIDVRGGAADVTVEAVSALPTSPTVAIVQLAGTGASDTLFFRNMIFMTELSPTGL